jgi:4-hydroxybenzoate polyprenyltransferase
MDVSEDRLHPKKRNRPIANGDISIKGGIVIFIILFVMSVSLSFLFKLDIQIVLLIYFVINILYSIWLKKVPVIDIMMVASGFLLRAIAGAFVINVVITNWFLVCNFMIV